MTIALMDAPVLVEWNSEITRLGYDSYLSHRPGLRSSRA